MSSGDLHKAVQTCDAWHQSYPRDPIAALHLGSACTPLAQWEKALAATQQAVEIDHSAVGHSNLAIILLAMGRFADARATLENAFARNFDAYYLHLDAYQEAFLRGDTVSMELHVAAVMGRPGEEDFLLATQADTEAYFGRLRQARELSRRAVDSARRADAAETAATWRVEGSLREAELGHGALARDDALAALTLMPGRYVACMAGAALARSGETARAQEIVASLDREYPQDTLMQFYWLPSVRAAIALGEKDWGLAVQILEGSVSIESGQTPPLEFGMLYPAYLRGQAYLAGRMGAEAAREFQKLIDRPGLLKNFILFPLAHLGSARAHALAGNRDKSRAAYDRFLELWKSADADLAILGEAKAERARS
jgi:tetratricopeptide (TPR) repeat protein